MQLSIITINLNNAAGLKRTMDAISAELSADMEWIIIDGGSSDGSQEIIKSFSRQIAHWTSEPDNGIYDAMNKGVKAAQGEWVWFMNSGDLPVPGMIKKLLSEDLSDYQIVYGQNFSAINGIKGKLVIKDYAWTLLSFMNGCIPHQSTLTRRNVLLQTPFKEQYKIAGCRIFFIETIIQKSLKYKYFPIPLSICDLSGISSTQKNNLLKELDSYLQMTYGDAVCSDLKKLQKFQSVTENRSLFDLIQYSSGRPKLKRWLDKSASLLLKILPAKV